MEAAAMEAAAMEASTKLQEEVNNSVSKALDGVQNYIAFNLQRSYFKCASRCFDIPGTSHKSNAACVEKCSVPLERANGILSNELAKFQEKLQRSVMVCRDKMENHPSKDPAVLASSAQACVESSVKEHLGTLPKLADKLMSQIRIKDDMF